MGNIGARLDRLPISRFHYRILWLIGMGMFFDTFDIYLAGGVLASMVKEGFSTVSLNATFVSSTFIGLVIGAFLSGVLGDRFGRKFSYQFNLLIFGLASLASAFAPNMATLIVLRGIAGLGLGAEIVIGFASLSEFVPAEKRGKWQSALSLINNSSLAVSAILGYWIIPNMGWRYMFALVGIGALVIWYCRKSLPESPRWYEARGMHQEAEQILAKIEAEIEAEKGIKLPKAASSSVSHSQQDKSSIMELLKKPLLKRTIVSCIIFIAMVTALYVFITWIPTIFVKQGINLSTSLGYVAIISLGGPIGSAVGMLIGDRFSRKWTTAILALICGLLGYLYAVQSNINILLLLGFLLVGSMYAYNAIGFGAYVSELFPTPLRLRGCGITNTAGRFFTIFSPYWVAYVLNGFGPKLVYLTVTVVFLIAAIVIAIWGVETRRKSLEEIGELGLPSEKVGPHDLDLQQ